MIEAAQQQQQCTSVPLVYSPLASLPLAGRNAVTRRSLAPGLELGGALCALCLGGGYHFHTLSMQIVCLHLMGMSTDEDVLAGATHTVAHLPFARHALRNGQLQGLFGAEKR